MRNATLRQWKHPSVTLFAGSGDPVHRMMDRASETALTAMQDGWSGPPFDPFSLADMLGIATVPNSDVLDARTVPLRHNRVQIEYNPSRPRARIRYSVAHEIAHTFFPDCSEQIRYRAQREHFGPHDWELEMLCNIGAAELLMPTGSLEQVRDKKLSLQDALDLRKQFEVSTESVILRLIRITGKPYTMFVASRSRDSGRYKIDYSVQSRSSGTGLPDGHFLPSETIVATCTAVGYTATADEIWPLVGKVHVECVGVVPYEGSNYPRVIGLLRKNADSMATEARMQFVTGDATEPCGTGRRILAHVVNDATPNWGVGFGRVVQSKWPGVQRHFREAWPRSATERLGSVFCSEIEQGFSVCQMICQKGYGPAERPRLRYAALRQCLSELRDTAVSRNASVHMPRIGTGEAGGSWALVGALIDEILCAGGVSVTIYDLPKSRKVTPVQSGLFDRKL